MHGIVHGDHAGLAGAIIALRTGIPDLSGSGSGPDGLGLVVVDAAGLVEPVEYPGGSFDTYSGGETVGDLADADPGVTTDDVEDPFF